MLKHNSSTISSSSFSWLKISRQQQLVSNKQNNKNNNNKTSSLLPPMFQCLVTLRVTPGSKRNQITVSPTEPELALKITAPPVEGKANAAIVETFEEFLKSSPSQQRFIAKSDVQLVSGSMSRNKIIQFNWFAQQEGASDSEVEQEIIDMFRELEKDGF